MNDWLKEYQQAWKTVHVNRIDERLTKLWEVIKEDQKKDSRSSILMSLAFFAAIVVILWVAISNEFSSLTSWTTVISMITLMILTSFLKLKAITIAPDPGKSEKEHIDKLIESYSLRLKMQRQYIWLYLIVLNLLLIVFFIDSYYPGELKVLTYAIVGTISYSVVLMIILNKKRKKDIEFVLGVINELESMKSDLKE